MLSEEIAVVKASDGIKKEKKGNMNPAEYTCS